MEEGSKKGQFDCENMTVIKHSNTIETSNNNCSNKLIQSNQCTSHEEESRASSGKTERNILCYVDDPESSAESEVENVCLQDNIGESESDSVCVEHLNPSEDQENRNSSTQTRTDHRDDDVGCQETDALASASGSPKNCESNGVPPHSVDDEEIFRRAREEGRVNVIFPGCITQDGCCRFVGELLKCVLYQRQQMPMTYDQMVFLQKQQHNASQDIIKQRSAKASGGLDWRRCQKMLQELDDVLAHLEALFSLSRVPRVLFMLGGSTVLPTELYEVNMESVAVGAGENSLRTSTCLRQIFRTLFVADLLSDAKSVRLMSTTVLALGHRDCGVTGFKPRVDFKVPTKVKRQVISIASDLSLAGELPKTDLEDYIWFQAPVTVKGFCK